MKDFIDKAINLISEASRAAAEKTEISNSFPDINSQQSLISLVETKLSGRKLIIASNREPYVHIYRGDSIAWYRSAGGLTVALDSMAAACNAIWVCHGEGNADFRMTNGRGEVGVPPDNPKYLLKRMRLTKREVAEYYEGFSNETLWPLCHVSYVRPKFIYRTWLTYQEVNRKFADAILEAADPNSIIFLQDYHLCLVAKYLKEAMPGLTTVLFWHIPWPNHEIFRICPWKRDILEGLLSNDIVGFHLKYHADNFAETVDRELECRIDREKMIIERGQRATRIRAYPISIDFKSIYLQAEDQKTHDTYEKKITEMRLRNVKVGLGVDRLDYTKGIPERIDALDRLFEKYREHQGAFTFIQVGVPSRTHIEDYQHVVNDIESKISALNEKYRTDEWEPVIFLKGQYDFDVLIPFYKMADVCIVSALHDGMNLVAKEFIAASSNDRGVLILSNFTGAARELEHAIIINPYDTESFADIIHSSILMPREEQKMRLSRMRLRVAENNIYTWAQKILNDVIMLAEDNVDATREQGPV
jgi:alpha,alpha-trehalose-phosphate synthase [UDP-forming]